MYKWVERPYKRVLCRLTVLFLENANDGMLSVRALFMVAFQSRARILQYPAVVYFFTYVFGDRRCVGHGYYFLTFAPTFHLSWQFNTKSHTAFHLTKKIGGICVEISKKCPFMQSSLQGPMYLRPRLMMSYCRLYVVHMPRFLAIAQ